MGNGEYKTIAYRTKEGITSLIIVSVAFFLVFVVMFILLIINGFDLAALLIAIISLSLGMFCAFMYFYIKHHPRIELIKYNREYLIIINKQIIKWDDIDYFDYIKFDRGFFNWNAGHLKIILKNHSKITIYWIDKIDLVTTNLIKLKNNVSWKR